MEKDSYTKILSANLKAIRESKGLTTFDVAKILNVSQSKVSYIENCKGILSAKDIAVLSNRLGVPIADFFHGLVETEDSAAIKEIAGSLVSYGASHLAKPPGPIVNRISFEEIFARSLAFIEDDRLHKALLAASITQASEREINVDRIFAIIGNNPFLVAKTEQQATLCLEILTALKGTVRTRAAQQIKKIRNLARELVPEKNWKPVVAEELEDYVEFVEKCLDGQKRNR